MAHTATPALDADNVVALGDDTELQTVRDGPLETTVDVLLPDLDVEVGLVLGEEEGPDTTVKVGILRFFVSRCNQTELVWLTLEATGLRETMRIGQTGRYLERRRAVLPLSTSETPYSERQRKTYLVVKTTMAPALISRLALTAAMAMDSVVSHGRGQRLRSSSNTLK